MFRARGAPQFDGEKNPEEGERHDRRVAAEVFEPEAEGRLIEVWTVQELIARKRIPAALILKVKPRPQLPEQRHVREEPGENPLQKIAVTDRRKVTCGLDREADP